MSTTYYSPSRSAADSEAYVRGQDDSRGAAISCDVPGGPGSWSRAARALAQANNRQVEALHYRQSFSAGEFDPDSPEDVQRVNDLGYLLAKKMHPHSDALVVTHLDGKGGQPHNHLLIINHHRETARALDNYRTHRDRPDQGGQRGVQSANDELMREHGLSVARRPQLAPQDWEIRWEDFTQDGLDREMGDRFQAALDDPRSVNEDGLRAVLEDQNQQTDEHGDRVPRMRLITTTHKKTGDPVWTLKIQDRRDDSRRAERRALCSRLSADFTPQGAAAFFDYHQHMKEQDDDRIARQAEAAGRAAAAAERAQRAAATARGLRRHDDRLDLDPGRRREPERADHGAGRTGEDAGPIRSEPAVDLVAVQQQAAADRRRREQARRDRDDAGHVPDLARRREPEQRNPGFADRGETESLDDDFSM
ncbi:relaxase/mobilization nuclease domain-containing protein [Leekyejoonella antrihumi]|uniref:Mobilization protein n=1 Tax=Leekyejoonella antrihumi TaxID=1660198 RepID=A0A563DUD6_9MICO|nr:relaxase/mobilization nuclease domain-containing protein [Leekyejoonella antrihumi]TWP33543.1 mobilization protein [Leekyejoonella antrihumi]